MRVEGSETAVWTDEGGRGGVWGLQGDVLGERCADKGRGGTRMELDGRIPRVSESRDHAACTHRGGVGSSACVTECRQRRQRERPEEQTSAADEDICTDSRRW